jgi:hypothetical protein
MSVILDVIRRRKAELLAEQTRDGANASPAVAAMSTMVDVALLRWIDAEATLRAVYEAVERRGVELGEPRTRSAEDIASMPIEELFGKRLAYLRSHLKAAKR